MAETFLSQRKNNEINLFEAPNSHFVLKWNKEHGPSSDFEVLMLFGAVDNDNVELAANLIPGNPRAKDVILDVKSVAMLDTFLTLGIDPIGDRLISNNAFVNLLRKGCYFGDVFKLMWEFYRETLPKELFNFFTEEIANDWEDTVPSSDGTARYHPSKSFRRLCVLRGYWKEFTLDLNKVKTKNLDYALKMAVEFELVSKKEILEFISGDDWGCDPLLSLAEKYFPKEIKEKFGEEIFTKNVLKVVQEEKVTEDVLLSLKKSLKKEGPPIIIFLKMCEKRNLEVIRRLLLITDFPIEILSEGVKKILFMDFGCMINLEKRHILLKMLLDSGGKFDQKYLMVIEDDNHNSITNEIIKTLIEVSSKEELKKLLPTLKSKKLAGRFAYYLNE